MDAEVSGPLRTPHTGRGVAMRFHGLADLGTVPAEIPSPPTISPVAPPPSRDEGDLPFLTIAQAAPLIASGQLSPVELTRAFLARIERLNPVLNAYITVTAELALSQAREAEREIRAGHYRGPLHGIPMALKDLIASEGVLTTGGTAALSDWVPRESAVVWQRLREAGAVLLGKLGLHEMAAGFTNVNPFYGATLNPWDTSKITGGSSGGSGAALAARLCMASIGSDTAGSIRVPSALCGIIGLKPTFGRVSTRGALYLSWSLDHLGPMTRTAEDAALVMNAIAAHDPANPLSAHAPQEDHAAGLGEGVRGLRLGIPANHFWEFDVPGDGDGPAQPGLDPQVADAVRRGIALLQKLGATTEDVTVAGLDELPQGTADMYAERGFFLEELPPERRERFSRRYRDSLVRGLAMPAASYMRTLQHTMRVQMALETALQGFDALIMPTTPILAPSLDAVETAAARDEAEGVAAAARGEPPPPTSGPTASVGRYTSPFNRSGHPAISVPCGFSREGLPIGMMLVGGRFQEAKLLRIAHTFQRATEWHTRRPPLDG